MLSAAANTNNGTADLRIIILAAGEGMRMNGLTRHLHGRDVPKQFAELLVGRSLLQDTVARASRLASPDRMYVVVPRAWATVSRHQLAEWPGVNLVVQPENRGMAIGLLLPLAVVLHDDADARVVVVPSAHYVSRPEPFVAAIARALRAGSTSYLALLGVVPDRTESDYGWILPGALLEEDVYQVAGFAEDPSAVTAERMQAAGGLWNTLLMAARGNRLWAAISATMPGIATTIATLWQREDLLREAYRTLPSVNLGPSLLARHANLAVVPLQAPGWAAWSYPAQVFRSLQGTDHLRPLLARLQKGSGPAGPEQLLVE